MVKDQSNYNLTAAATASLRRPSPRSLLVDGFPSSCTPQRPFSSGHCSVLLYNLMDELHSQQDWNFFLLSPSAYINRIARAASPEEVCVRGSV